MTGPPVTVEAIDVVLVELADRYGRDCDLDHSDMDDALVVKAVLDDMLDKRLVATS